MWMAKAMVTVAHRCFLTWGGGESDGSRQKLGFRRRFSLSR